jgi:cation-transporting ATPase E
MKETITPEKNAANAALQIPTAPPQGTVPTPKEGLTQAEAAKRAAAGQSNRQTADPGKSVPRIVADNLFTLFNLLNFALAFCLALVGSWKNMLFLGVVFSNTLIGTVQELRARAMLNKLRLLEVRDARVIRDGREQKCPPDDLVLGDLAVFSAGDQIPADAMIADGVCAADESLLTGESEPVTHKPGDLLMSGSFLTEGRVTAQLIAVGDDSYAARLMKEAKQIRSPKSELMTELNKLVSLVSKLLVPIGVLLFLEQVLLQKAAVADAVPKAVAAMIGMIPEGLILLTSVALMAGVVKLGRRQTLVQELFGIETLARVDLLCTDKTGTLTTGEMALDRFIPLEADEQELKNKAADFVSAFVAESGTLRAIAEAFQTGSSRRADAVLPFSSARKKSAASFADGKTLILGAPSFVTDAVPPPAARAPDEGFRVQLLAEAEGRIENDQIPPVTRLLGLFLLRETLRPSAKDTVQWFKREGVSVRVMSGDDPRTVAAIGRALELEGCDKTVDCARLTDEELCAAAGEHVVFGRLTPDRKRILVDALKKAGHHVAMTGDGVNDIPSLKAADCSIAMAGGAEATEHAAQLVLLNNDFILPAVVAEGRRVIGNITRTASLFLQKTLYSFALSVLNLLIGLFLPLQYPFQPIHLTLVSALTVGIPSFFLALEPSSERAKGNFLKRIILRAAPAAFAVVCCALAAMIANHLGIPDGVASTMAVLSAGVIGLGNLMLTCMPFSKLRIAVCALMCAGFAGAVALFPGIFSLHTAEMTPEHWGTLAIMTAGGLAVLLLGSLLLRPAMKKLEAAG